jgi:tetratricopeptide (TPR) repeat protein
MLCAVEWDWPASERVLRRAIELDPNHVAARLYLAILLAHTLRCDESVAVATQALTLDPLSPALNMTLGRAHMYGGRPADAVRPLQTAVEIAPPQFTFLHRQLGDALLLLGRREEALESFRRASASGGAGDLGHLAFALATTGRRDEAEAILHGLLAHEAEAYLPPVGVAAAYAGLGELDSAVAWLERGHAERAVNMNWINVAPMFAPLRPHPRFRALLRRLDLPLPPTA